MLTFISIRCEQNGELLNVTACNLQYCPALKRAEKTEFRM